MGGSRQRAVYDTMGTTPVWQNARGVREVVDCRSHPNMHETNTGVKNSSEGPDSNEENSPSTGSGKELRTSWKKKKLQLTQKRKTNSSKEYEDTDHKLKISRETREKGRKKVTSQREENKNIYIHMQNAKQVQLARRADIDIPVEDCEVAMGNKGHSASEPNSWGFILKKCKTAWTWALNILWKGSPDSGIFLESLQLIHTHGPTPWRREQSSPEN